MRVSRLFVAEPTRTVPFSRKEVSHVEVGPSGVATSVDWHVKPKQLAVQAPGAPPTTRFPERAVLSQSTANLAALCESFPAARATLLGPASFGENMLLEGGGVDVDCVGDVLAVVGPGGVGRGTLLQVASPRRPCSQVDQAHGQQYNASGVRQKCVMTGLSGTLYRVLAPGSVHVGDCLVLQDRPHPSWTLHRVASLLYGSPVFSPSTVASWRGTAAELDELAAIQELGECEYREEVRALHGMLVASRRRRRHNALTAALLAAAALVVGFRR